MTGYLAILEQPKIHYKWFAYLDGKLRRHKCLLLPFKFHGKEQMRVGGEKNIDHRYEVSDCTSAAYYKMTVHTLLAR